MNTNIRLGLSSALVVLLGSIAVLTGFGKEPSDAAGKSEKRFTIENCVNSFDREKASESDLGYRYWFVDKDFLDGRTVKLSVVAPNQATHPPHTHDEDEVFFVLEGSASFHLDGETTVVGPYTSLYCPADIAHGISNAGDAELKYLVIKKYKM
jgi:mannose-6-phosphate isomerase-like protein (cupin superfamily)